MTTDTRRANEAAWRIEELAQDALVAALEQWPAEGVPRNPGAWLMTTAKRRAIDQIRRNETFKRKVEEVGRELEESTPVACHPVLSTESRAALTLRLLGGLTTDEIARAFLVPEPTVAQRIVRAKETLANAQVPYEVPQGDELAALAGGSKHLAQACWPSCQHSLGVTSTAWPARGIRTPRSS